MSDALGRARWLLALAVVAAFAALPSTASPISGTHKWAMVLCNFSNHQATPYSISYYEQMFEGGGGSVYDFQRYWTDNSYGGLSAAGTTVTGWHTLSITRDAWIALSRGDKMDACGDKAAADGFNFSGYYGFVVIFPETKTTLASSIDSSQTTITVASANSTNTDQFPTPPFQMYICNSIACGTSEIVNVTAINGTTFTVQRGQGGTSAKPFTAPGYVFVAGDIFGNNPASWTLGSNTFTLGYAMLPSDVNMTGAAHETGHGYGWGNNPGGVGGVHSRTLSTSTSDYGDCYDIMSAYATCSFTAFYGGTNLGSVNAAAGPGITGILLDQQGWLAGGRVFDLDNSSCNQTTMDLVALNQNGIAGKFVARIPASVVIPTPGNTTTTSDKYWLEYREATGWDQGVPPGVILHLRGGDNYAYWVDSATSDGRLVAGEEYVDAPQKTYVGVNKLDTGTHKAQITIAGCKIDTSIDYVGATSGEYSDSATLAANLTVSGSSAPIPNASVNFTLGSQGCSDTTDASGHAECTITLNQVPGAYTVSASYAGEPAYNSASDSASFTIEKEDTVLTYTGATTQDYHDPFTASGTLVDDDGDPVVGRTVSFTLGVGDTCSDATDGSGVASCSITPTQAAGTYTLASAFAGDAYYEPSSDSDSFEITHEESTTTYTGPTVILAGSGVTATLSAQFVEDGANDDDGDGGPFTAVPSGQTILFSLGSESCSGTTNASGVAQCTVNVPPSLGLGPQTVTTTFAGDAYYLPSSDSDSVIVFAFPSRGAFVLGDNTVASATPSTTVSWWSDTWWTLNTLSGGLAPDSFKGFAGTATTLPTTSPANVCGTTFTTLPGNSPPPTSGVPSYMGVLVASSVTKSGNTINGTWAKIVVVRTAPGYAPNPGHPGTGTIVATFCP